jgi:hypothetical protein
MLRLHSLAPPQGWSAFSIITTTTITTTTAFIPAPSLAE